MVKRRTMKAPLTIAGVGKPYHTFFLKRRERLTKIHGNAYDVLRRPPDDGGVPRASDSPGRGKIDKRNGQAWAVSSVGRARRSQR
jgi:hypothetical protein